MHEMPEPVKLIAFGDVNVDLVTEIPHKQKTDDVLPQSEAHLLGGGTIGNTATGTARLGVETIFLGKVGLDGYGRFLKEEFEKDGVNTAFLIEDPLFFTVMVIAFIDSAGEKYNVTFPKTGGAHLNITVPEIDPRVWNGARWFHTSGMALGEEPCRSTSLELMRQARARGIKVSFDLNLRLEYFGWRPGVRNSALEAMALSDVIFASIDEELLPITGENDIAGAIKAFSKLYPSGNPYLTPDKQIIIGRQGGEPAIVYEKGRSFQSPGFQVEVIDTLGAGDAFNAGYIAAQLEGKDLGESLTWAHGTAAFKLTRKGARGMPSRKELLEFLSTHKRNK